MRKKNKQLTITCIVLSVIIVLLIAYILHLKTTTNNEIKPQEEKNTTEKKVIKEKEFNLEDAKLLLEEFGFNRRVGCETVLHADYDNNFKGIVVLEKLINEKGIDQNCNDLFTEEKLIEAPELMYKSTLGVCFKDKIVKTITYSDANEIYKKMYGEDMPTNNVNGLDNNNLDYTIFEYLTDKNIFTKLDLYGVGGSCMSSHIRVLKSATRKDNIVKINVYDYESGYIELINNKYNFITDKISTEIECTTFEQCKQIIKEEYTQYLDEYEITFEIIDNHYIFKSVNQVI